MGKVLGSIMILVGILVLINPYSEFGINIPFLQETVSVILGILLILFGLVYFFSSKKPRYQ